MNVKLILQCELLSRLYDKYAKKKSLMFVHFHFRWYSKDMSIQIPQSLINDVPPAYLASNVSSIEDAKLFCKKLATSHYENFLVSTLFLPKPLRQHFYNLYAYCRISDDLGDEIGNPAKSLQLLDWWEGELTALYSGHAHHAVFIALAETVEKFDIPIAPFRNLLTAFRQDQITTRYETFEDVQGYCVNSANPVGHLVLYLSGYKDEQRQKLSDYTCTALQLANFWQDIVRDYEKDRIYIPLEDMRKFDVTEEQIKFRIFTPQFADLMKYQVERTFTLFQKGEALLDLVDRRVKLDIAMFSQGGTEVLKRIQKQGYDTLSSRPSISKNRQLAMLFGRLLKR